MRSAVLLKIDNVLTKEGVGGPVTDPGLQLLRMVQSLSEQIYFLTECEERQRVLDWLFDELHLKVDKPRVIDAADDDPITTVRYLGFEVLFYIDADPLGVAYAMDKGVTAMLVAAPEYMRPEFRPGHRGPVAPWASLVSTIDARRAERASDDRLTDDFVDGRYGE